MVIKSDIALKGNTWRNVTDKLKDIFISTPHYSIFMLALSIGIMYDQRKTIINEQNDEDKSSLSVPRNVINNNDNGKLDFYFQAAILSTSTENFSEDERLELAFGDESEFNKIGFLTEFAYYGVSKLESLIGISTIETMENIKNFCAASVEGRNLDIDSLPDDILISNMD